jgi:hypothetical protein
MITRVAAGFFLIGIAAIAVSPEVFARGAGGFMGGRAVSSPGTVHAHPTTAPIVRPGGALAGGRGVTGAHAFRRDFFGHRSRFRRGAFLGRQWYDGWYGSYDYGPYDYGSNDYGGGYYGYGPTSESPPAYPVPGYPVGGDAPDTSQKVIYVLPYRPGCDSETQKVPGKNGGEHAVTIVRC